MIQICWRELQGPPTATYLPKTTPADQLDWSEMADPHCSVQLLGLSMLELSIRAQLEEMKQPLNEAYVHS